MIDPTPEGSGPRRFPPGGFAAALAALVLFVLLATANSAGYRYGASDLAFYGPAVMRNLEPRLFPHDRPLIDAQARLTLMDETIGTIARLSTRRLPVLFLALYVATLTLLAAAAVAVGRQVYRHWWTTAALLAALTMRHAIARSGTNTLEGYFHPRQLAFAFGVLAVAAFLRGRAAACVAALAGAALLHPTTTLWFAIWLAVAAVVGGQRGPAWLVAGAAAGLAAAWAIVAGPLAGRLTLMDAEWLEALAAKDYLFPFAWPAFAWIVNLGYVPLIGFLYRRRVAAGVALPREGALVAGVLALAAVFIAAALLNVMRVALAIQLQPARVFWMLDLMATVYAVWWLAEAGSGRVRRARLAAAAVTMISLARGVYIMTVEFPDRPLVSATVPGDWGRVAEWARTTPIEGAWLADPAHAARYGTSLRMAAGRDVFVEAAKDGAIGMYDRRIALQVRDRLRELTDFGALSPERARALAARYDLEYLVTEEELALPQAFRSGPLRVYRLR